MLRLNWIGWQSLVRTYFNVPPWWLGGSGEMEMGRRALFPLLLRFGDPLEMDMTSSVAFALSFLLPRFGGSGEIVMASSVASTLCVVLLSLGGSGEIVIA